MNCCSALIAYSIVVLSGLTFPALVSAQSASIGSTSPVVGLRENPGRTVVLQDATVVIRPGKRITHASIVLRGEQIVAVGKQIDVPAGAQIVACTGKTIYPGLIDAYREIAVDWPSQTGGYWNANVTPRRHAETAINKTQDSFGEYRKQGITIQVLAPQDRIIKGQSTIVLCRDAQHGSPRMCDTGWQHLQLTVPRRRTAGESYPNSPMGAFALLRQAFYDSIWYRDAWHAFQANSQLPRPEINSDLAALVNSMKSQTFVIDAPNERMAIRGCDLADEFSLNAILRGSGLEYQAITELKARHPRVLLPLDFPSKPNVDNNTSAREVDLRTMMHWELAPQNPKILHDSGVEFCFIGEGLDQVDLLLKNLRRAVQAGLPEDIALASLTTRPAEWLGIADQTGSIRTGKFANLVITDGDLFDEQTKILETWVAGTRYRIAETSTTEQDPLIGKWRMKVTLADKAQTFHLNIQPDKDSLNVELTPLNDRPKGKKKKQKKATSSTEPIKLSKVTRQRDQLTALIDFASLAELAQRELTTGIGSLEITSVISQADELSVSGHVISPTGESLKLKLTRESESPASSTEKSAEHDKSEKKNSSNDPPDKPVTDQEHSTSIVAHYPLGAFGSDGLPDQPSAVLFRNATVWTCANKKPAEVDVLVETGKISQIGPRLKPPPDCQVIDLKHKHLTPGLIDCHSHMATDGGVNESGQAVTAEVRIGDFIDNTDITIYRQLAGGVTTANILHGSANPIGGQNQVIKLRWGGSMSELPFKDAPLGIKFALGENVKRNPDRYPNTRMGVEQLIRDQFLAAREYLAQHRRYASGERNMLPPRRDLQLEAIAEIQNHERWIHCHSYRQDEIIATLDVLEEFGVQIGSLQHILEGYKVADRMAKHGAMASSFSDWWAYKFEVFDAIPYNGVLMHDAGIVVSYNSDDAELGRHLNTEAAKAVKYGGVDPVEALKFVTLNPAKQLRIDDRVGSIEPGKDADLVVWSGPPLSTTSRCEQTWIDGRRFFDINRDQELRVRDQALRAKLIQKIRDSDHPGEKDANSSAADKDEADRWLRFDEYCNAKGNQGRQ